MKAILEIRRNADGKVVTHPYEWIWDDDDTDAFMWSDGNYSCDCNRSDFFHQAMGLREEVETPCGHERFSVRLKDKETGNILFQDDDWEDE